MNCAGPINSAASLAAARRAGRRGAFTLIELVLVLVVLCVMAGAVIPQLRGFLTFSASRDAATQVVALAQYARAKAAYDSLVYRLSFDETTGEYWLSVSDAGGSGEFVSLGDDLGQVFTLPKGMTATLDRLASNTSLFTSSTSSSATDVDFRPDGTSDSVIIRLTGSDGVETLIAAPAATEAYRVMTPQEVDEL